MEKYLYSFNFDCGRMGSLKGLFVSTEDEVKSLIGKYAHFGEVLGKHSEVHGDIEESHITKLDLDSETVEKVKKVLGWTWSGYDPRDYVYYDCPKCENKRFHSDEFNVEKNMCWDCSE